MILYTNGDGHVAASYAVNTFAAAHEDKQHWAQVGQPHPGNLAVSWSSVLSGLLKSSLFTEASPGKPDTEVIKTTTKWIDEHKNISNKQVLMVIQFNDANLEIIWDFHLYLKELGFNHIFFNGNNQLQESDYDFGSSFIDPTLAEGTYSGWLQFKGFDTVITSNTFFGADAHAAWAKHLVKHIIGHNLI